MGDDVVAQQARQLVQDQVELVGGLQV